ncbi:hypothetical protein GY45DRAFT_445433 [Cubamyces sp. BRFM 1775]|nr:hypothetical protein GY45DRAFT_445433 [Cubamyces sp. BRFM 1775]
MRAAYTVWRPRYHNAGSRMRRATTNVTHTHYSVHRRLAHVRHQEALPASYGGQGPNPLAHPQMDAAHAHTRPCTRMGRRTRQNATEDGRRDVSNAEGRDRRRVLHRPNASVVRFAIFVFALVAAATLPGTPAPWRHDFAATTTKNPRPEVPILRGSNAWVRRLAARATATGLGCPSPARSPYPGSWTRHYVGPSVPDFIRQGSRQGGSQLAGLRVSLGRLGRLRAVQREYVGARGRERVHGSPNTIGLSALALQKVRFSAGKREWYSRCRVHCSNATGGVLPPTVTGATSRFCSIAVMFDADFLL